MPTRYRFIDTQEDVFGAFKQEINGDLISRPANWLKLATTDELTAAGIESYEYTPPPPPPPSTDPVDYPLTPIQFFAMLHFIKADTGTDMEALIRAAIVASTGGDPNTLAAIAGITTFERSTQYRYDHPLSVAAAQQMAMSDNDRTAYWMQAKDL